MMSIEFENKIEKTLNEEVVIPESVLQKKELAFSEIRKKKKKKLKLLYKEVIAASILVATIVGGITYGNTAIAAIEKTIFNKDDGIQKAIDNGYIQKVENNVMKDKGVEIKINNIVKDSKRFAFTLNLKFDDKNLIKHLKDICLRYNANTNNGNILYNGECSYNADKEKGEVTITQILILGQDSEKISDFGIDINRIELVADASTDIDRNTLPKIENGIKENFQKQGLEIYKVIEGTWKTNANINLDDKFKAIKPIQYKASENNDYIKIISAEMLPTGMDVTFNFIKERNFCDDETINEIKSFKLADEKGNIYKLTRNGSMIGNNNVTETFCATTFDNVGNLKLIFNDSKGKTHEIKLNKVSEP